MYLLVKGCNGFGNLISILNYAYCIAYRMDMTLVVGLITIETLMYQQQI